MSEKYGNSMSKRPFFIIMLIGFFLILLLVLTFFAYQIGRRAGEQSEVGENEKGQNAIATTIAGISPFNNSEENIENSIGTIRTNPHPAGSIVDAHQWTIEVIEVERGDSAWQSLHNAHPYNEVPLAGEEYLNVKLRVNNNALQEEFFSFGLTGDALIKYLSHENSLISPEPWLERTVPARKEFEGWETFVIQEDEGNLMLIFDIGDYDDPPVYLALEEGAHISFDESMVNITRTDLGITEEQPVPFGQTATGEDWQVIVQDYVKGDEAWEIILDENQFNDPPEDGMEYLMIKLWMRYIGANDEGANINYRPFTILTNSGKEFDNASVVVPEPALDYTVYPGGEVEGWIVMNIPEKPKSMMLYFSPDKSGANDRYLSLGQGR